MEVLQFSPNSPHFLTLHPPPLRFSNPRRICLFSLGTLSVYSKCRQELLQNHVTEVIAKMKETEEDQVAVKYLERVGNKLRGNCIG